jgi:broad specificity polyphosphatase/5'/3'-nucleotidase SurE
MHLDYEQWQFSFSPGIGPRQLQINPLEKAEPDTDRWAIENGWISITPLRLDLTDETALARALE